MGQGVNVHTQFGRAWTLSNLSEKRLAGQDQFRCRGNCPVKNNHHLSISLLSDHRQRMLHAYIQLFALRLFYTPRVGDLITLFELSHPRSMQRGLSQTITR